MKIKRSLPLLCVLTTLSLSACNQKVVFISDSYVDVIVHSNRGTSVEYIDASSLRYEYRLATLEPKTLENRALMPSTGSVSQLIIPVILPGYETIDLDGDGQDDKDKIQENIAKTFFNQDCENYQDSVFSFFKQSSFGGLNLGGLVTKWFNAGEICENIPQNPNDFTKEDIFNIIQTAVDWVENTGYYLPKFDSNHDGYIDSIWIVTSYKGETNNENLETHSSWMNNPFFDTRDNLQKADENSPVASVYGLTNYETFTSNKHPREIFHEIGHMMGLKDTSSSNGEYSPLGKLDIMGSLTGDLNSYHKMLLAWSKPYFAISSVKFRIHSHKNKHCTIAIPVDSLSMAKSEFNLFSEFILVDLYTNEGISKYDSVNIFTSSYLAPNDIGVRIYYVNNPLFKINLDNNFISLYKGDGLNTNERFFAPIENSNENNIYNTKYQLSDKYTAWDEVRIIEKIGVDTFSNNGNINRQTFFRQGDIFEISNYKAYFPNNTLLSGESFTSKIEISTIKDKR